MSHLTVRFTPSSLFDALGDREFDDYAKFQRAVLEIFNEHVRDFPAGYTFMDAIVWAVRRNRVRRQDDRIVVSSG